MKEQVPCTVCGGTGWMPDKEPAEICHNCAGWGYTVTHLEVDDDSR